MEVTAVAGSDHLSFHCPACKAALSWSTAHPSSKQPSFPASCEQCGVTFSVSNPSVVGEAASPLVAQSGASRFCVKCGTRIVPGQAFCSSCGAASTGEAGGPASELGKRIATSSADALTAMRRLATDPVSGLAPAYTALGDARAQAAGIALAVFFALESAVGVSIGAKRALGGLFSFVPMQGFGGFLKLAVVFLIFPAAMTVIAFGVRKVLGGAPAIAADLFTCGAAVTPLGVALLLSGLLGGANVEVIALLLMFASTYLLLMLFAGLTRIGKITERAAAPTLPVVFVLTGWLSKVVFVAMFT